jgi:hypothetical protein
MLSIHLLILASGNKAYASALATLGQRMMKVTR